MWYFVDLKVLCSVTSSYNINLVCSDDMDGANDVENDGESGKWFLMLVGSDFGFQSLLSIT
jgi:hypothetical protein